MLSELSKLPGFIDNLTSNVNLSVADGSFNVSLPNIALQVWSMSSNNDFVAGVNVDDNQTNIQLYAWNNQSATTAASIQLSTETINIIRRIGRPYHSLTFKAYCER